jgi:hypothetical protein
MAAALFELSARWLWITDGTFLYPRSHQLFVYDPDLNYRLRPNFSIAGETSKLHLRVGFRVNELHLRGPSPDARDSWVVVGDSVAFGFGVEESETFCAQLENELGGAVQILNAGTPGYNTEQIALRARELVAQLQPRRVIVLLNANDAEARYFMAHAGLTTKRFQTYPWEAGQYPPNYPPEIALTVDPTKHLRLRALGALLGGKWPLKNRISYNPPPGPDQMDRYLEYEERQRAFWNSNAADAVRRREQAVAASVALVEDLAAAGTEVLVASFPWTVSVLRPRSETKGAADPVREHWLRTLRATGATKVVDLLPPLLAAERDTPQFLVADGHPNAPGHRTIALPLSKALRLNNAIGSQEPPDPPAGK